MDIMALLAVLSQSLDQTTLGQLKVIVPAVLAMTGRVTMIGIARWTEVGGSYRSIQRFYHASIPWALVFWLFFRAHLYRAGDEHLLIGDESVVTKAGKKTFGLDRFFSSLYGKPVPGLAFFTLSLVNVQERKSYPLLVEQVVRSAPEKVVNKVDKQVGKRGKSAGKQGKRGRPPGCKNKDKTQIEWNDELRLIERMVLQLLCLLAHHLPLTYFVLDGHFGHNNLLQMVRQRLSLHLISKLRQDAALYLPYQGEQKPCGPRRRYGAKLDYDHLPAHALVASTVQAGIQTAIYQTTLLHKSFAQPINVVILVKTNLTNHKKAHVLLFSSDLALAYDKLIDFYRLRFQIEFNFRDAKQFWGLEDFMNVKQTPVTNAANLAFFMVNVSYALLAHCRHALPDFSVLDLKAHFRSRRYLLETLKSLSLYPEHFFFDDLLDSLDKLGSIHQPLPISLPT